MVLVAETLTAATLTYLSFIASWINRSRAGGVGSADAEDRGVNAALDAGNNAGASAMARLDRELRKPTGSARNNRGLQQSRL